MFWSKDKITRLDRLVSIQDSQIHQLREQIKSLEDSRSSYNDRLKSQSKLVDEKLDVQAEHYDEKLFGMLKVVENKVRVLVGDEDKAKIIANLLKRIGELENQQECERKGRSFKEVIEKRDAVYEDWLKSDREDRENKLAKNQLDILNWVLGEENGTTS